MLSAKGEARLIDILVQTFNEELNLPHTLQSVDGWAGRVFVVDSGSTDNTAAIAEAAGATVVHHAFEGYAQQKNWALDNLPFGSPWVLIIDADEALTPQLRAEVIALGNRPLDSIAESAFSINRVLTFAGSKIWHCGYFPSWNVRLLRRGRARYEQRLVHEHMVVDGPVGRLDNLLLHEDRRGLEHFVAKHNRYSTLEAWEMFDHPTPWPGFRRLLTDEVSRKRFIKIRVVPHLPLPWLIRFVYMYVLRLGFMDGRSGWLLCNFIASYEFSTQLKYRELCRTQVRLPSGMNALSIKEGALSDTDSRPESAMDAETLPVAAIDDIDERSKIRSPWSFREKAGRALWMITWSFLFRTSFHNWYAWRRFLLRLFGARVGRQVRVRPSTRIEIPWNLTLGDSAIVGDDAILYSLGHITIGRGAIVSQYAHLCAGSHDYRSKTFDLLKLPITIGEDAWIAADAFIGPGVTVGNRSVIGARSSVFMNIPADVVAAGTPAKVLKPRERPQ